MKKALGPSLPDDTLMALKAIGEALTRARLARGDTQQVAAERIGAHAQTVARMERGEPGVAAGALLGLLAIYGHDKTVWQLAEDTQQTTLLAMRKLRQPRRPSAPKAPPSTKE